MPASRPALVLFDLDDVLCRYDRARRIRMLAAMAGLTPAEVERRIWGDGFEAAADAGAMDAQAYLGGFSARLGTAMTRESWAHARRAGMRPWPDALDLVARVKARVPVAVLSNNGFLFADMLPILFPALIPLFGERLLVSAAYGTKKPDPAIFTRALADLGAAPGETLFVDDKPWNVRGAQAAGLRGHVFGGVADLGRWLEEEGAL